MLYGCGVLVPGGPAALAVSVFNPAITVADGNSVIAVHTSCAFRALSSVTAT